jgi:hypothetical protein
MKRWPVVRHIRYWLAVGRVNRHYDLYLSIGMLPVNAQSDYGVCDAIWRGEI